MRKAKKIEVGSVIQFPLYQFAPQRMGWNGWIFRAGIVEKLYISKTGKKCAVVRYCKSTAGRYQMLPIEESTKRLLVEHLFEFNVDYEQKVYRKYRAMEKDGQEICWNDDIALLVSNGMITE